MKQVRQPAVVPPDDPKFREIHDYVEWLSDLYHTRFRAEGDEILVDTAA